MNQDYVLIDGELYHYGIPGMKWGHRKDYGTLGKGVKVRNRDIKDEEARRRDYHYNKMSTQKLRGLNKKMSRARNADEYARLRDEASRVEQESIIKANRQAAQDIVKKYGKTRVNKVRRDDFMKKTGIVGAEVATAIIATVGSIAISVAVQKALG